MPDIHLVDPNGTPWVAGTAEEANDLICQGYRRTQGPSQEPAAADSAPPESAAAPPASEAPLVPMPAPGQFE